MKITQSPVIRYSLALLAAVVCIDLMARGWIAYQQHWIQQRHQFKEDNLSMAFEGIGVEAPWQLRSFGEKGIATIFVRSKDDVATARALFPEVTKIMPLPVEREEDRHTYRSDDRYKDFFKQ